MSSELRGRPAARERLARSLRRWGWRTGRLWRAIERSFQAVLRNALRFIGLTIGGVCLLVIAVWLDEFRSSGALPGREPAVAVVLGLLLAATLLQVGPALARRLKKAGPFEFHVAEVERVLPELVETLERLQRVESKDRRPLLNILDKPPELTPEEDYRRRKAERLIDFFEFSNAADGGALKGEREVHELISRVAGLALDMKEHASAIDRLEYLLKVSEESYEPVETWTRLANASNLLAFRTGREVDRRRRELFEKAVEAGRRAIQHLEKSGRHEFRAYHERGLGHHQLGEHSAAVKFFNQALEIESTHATSRYNLAAALIKLGRLDEAVESLWMLDANDLEIGSTLALYFTDEEMAPLREDPDHGPQLARFICGLKDEVEGPKGGGESSSALRDLGGVDES